MTQAATVSPMKADIERVIITQEQIAGRIAEMAKEIDATYPKPIGITIVPILSGSVFFLARPGAPAADEDADRDGDGIELPRR